MKTLGAKSEYEDERANDIMRACREQMLESDVIYMEDIYRAIVEKPSLRFWVTEERAAIIIAAMMRGSNVLSTMRRSKREMFLEIFRRVKKMKKEFPSMRINELVSHVIHEPAPKFYMTAASAKKIILKAKRKNKRK
jgi:hypothetical protein